MFKISYLNEYGYPQNFTGVVVKNKPDRMLIDVNGAGYFREILKENIITFDRIKNSGYEKRIRLYND